MRDTVFYTIIDIIMPRLNSSAEERAEVIEALATCLGRAIAKAADGDKAAIETLLVGAENHMTNEAVSIADFVQSLRRVGQ